MISNIPVGLIKNKDALIIEWKDTSHSTFHYIWLRDNCPSSRHLSGQRILETTSIPSNIHPSSACITDNGDIELIWSHDGHVSLFSSAWLQEHDYSRTEKKDKSSSIKLWNASLNSALPSLSYSDITTNKEALKNWLRRIRDYGFAILHDVPIESGMVTQIAELFGYVRETNYGCYFNVKSLSNPNNLAYTSLALSPHTDNPYRDPVPTLQLLHCLSSHVEGGESILVDGFSVAEMLCKERPEQFKLLSTLPLTFNFADKNTNLTSETPIITCNMRGVVRAIHFNNPSVMPFQFLPELMLPYYEAYQSFAQILDDPAYQLRFKLKPGDLFIVDNQRVLHGRSSYSTTGKRHLQGCYADRDGLYSCLKMLEQQLKK